MGELIDAYDTLNVGRLALNHVYSGMTIFWSGSTGTDSLIRNNNSENLKNRATATGAWAGGIANAATATFAMALWGSGNTASTAYSAVINGRKNNVSGANSIILGGSGNTVNGAWSLITNGVSNILNSGDHTQIIGGHHNLINGDADFQTIIGGSGNSIVLSNSLAKHNIIAGGYSNYIGGGGGTTIGSAILGGTSNTVEAEYSAIIGGIGNISSVIGGVGIGGGGSVRYPFGLTIAGTNTTTPSALNNTISFDGVLGEGFAEGGFATGPADIAEMFEYADGNINNEDRRGYFVSITSGGTVEIGNYNLLGVVSVTPGYVGDSAKHKWSGIYMKDIWNKPIMIKYKFYSWTNNKKQHFRMFETTGGTQYAEYPNPSFPQGVLFEGGPIPDNAKIMEFDAHIMNPQYDPNEEYIPRSERKEWAPIGLLGKLYVRTAEQITGTHVDANSNGMAINGTKYSVIKHIKAYDNTYGIVQIFMK